MSEINFDLFKCRCSSIHKALANSRSNPTLTEKQAIRLAELEAKEVLTEKMELELIELLVKKDNGAKINLSDTYIEYLMEWYSWHTTGKVPVSKETMYIQYVEKGKEVEGDSILLLSMVEGVIYQKNEERVQNDYLSGIPDVFSGPSIMEANRVVDIKSAWDYPGFLKKINSPNTNGNDLQLKGYMDITGATEAEIAHCLVNTPESDQYDIRGYLLKKMKVVTEESPEFLSAYDELARSMVFDDIPIHKRVFKTKVEPFTEFDRQRVYDRVKIAREWLWNFHEQYESLNL
jgi:hypothetical protein